MRKKTNFKNIKIDKNTDLSKFKFTKGLETKLIEIITTGKIKDIDIEEENLKKLKASNPTVDTSNDESTIIDTKLSSTSSNIIKENVIPKDKYKLQNVVNKLDISGYDSIPKQLITQDRPSDEFNGAIYDLNLVTGIGNKNAEKFVKEGITIEVLLHDWNKFVEKDKNNSIIMINKIPRTSNHIIDQDTWDSLTEEKKHHYQLEILNNKLKNESYYLHKLNHHQLVGIKYFWDILQRIPRKEIIQTEEFLKRVAKAINKDIILTVCGSYRRGKSSSGDIDTLITHPKIKTEADLKSANVNILKTFVKQLEIIGFLVDHLVEFGNTKYMGIGLYSIKYKIARRIDIRFVPYNSYGAAILYFTGSRDFNTAMRRHAKKKGYKLSEYGLFKKEKINGEDKEILVDCFREEDIFTKLEYPYSKPTDRNI